MTGPQFDALAELARMSDCPSRRAARLVLVDGIQQADAARAAGCTPQSLNNALARCRKALVLARTSIGA